MRGNGARPSPPTPLPRGERGVTELTLNPKAEQALSVTARYSDGSTRDVTAMAEYFSQKPSLLQVSDTGVVKTLDGRGEGVVMVRYQGAVASARVLVPFRRDLPESAYAGFQPRGFIDEMVLKKWRILGIAPSPTCTDAEFLRRATLDVTGALPAPKEVGDFLADTTADKRERLVDRLLGLRPLRRVLGQQVGRPAQEQAAERLQGLLRQVRRLDSALPLPRTCPSTSLLVS